MSDKLLYFFDPALKENGVEFTLPRDGDAGFDLCAVADLTIEPDQQVLVPTGLRVAIPRGWVGIVKDRSSMALKRIYSHAGVIDADYRGEVRIVLSNSGSESFQIRKGDRIAQMVVVPCLTVAEEVDSLSGLGVTVRGDGGFGSTGE